MTKRFLISNERGIALLTVLLLSIALSALVLGAAMVSMNGGLIRRYGERLATVDDAAIAGLEEARSRLNGTSGLYPDTGYVTIESGVPVTNAIGDTLGGLTRWTYAGPSGVSSGQYGVFGSVISVVKDNQNVQVVRRLEINQESFAKYAYFTDIEPGNIWFGGGDQIFGPVHSNSQLKIHWTGARFRDEVKTASTVYLPGNGTFDKGFEENVSRIELPPIAALTKLQAQATTGNTIFNGFGSGGFGQARTRVEFVAIDLNADGDVTDDDEGFIRVYQGAAGEEDFVVADRPGGSITNTVNCGDFQGPHTPLFNTTASHPGGGPHSKTASLNNASARCFLGGDPNLTNGFVPNTANGSWLPWGGPIDARLLALRPVEAGYLHPITRALNPNYKGVIYVNGKVAVSGVVRGRVTVVSPSDIIIVDNVRQATDPSAGVCDDILGLVSVGNVIVADNLINAPVNVQGSAYKTMRPVGNQDEFIHAIILALGIFTVQNYNTGPTNRESCETTLWGRGCLRVTGGLIQRTRGAVGTTAGTGNLKRYSYNQCALSDPPPYFPTTGHFARNRFYEIDPIGFNVGSWFTTYQQ